ncbi:MAG: preprotein translocase subunit SecE [Planctomycetota bacterium]|nr:MAG: preprotein translocase subunit SecE [Planctomycetota bacterium]
MLYRWPQGRILRVIVLVAVILMALDLGLGAWGQYSAWATATERDLSNLIYMGLLGSLGAIILIYGVLAVVVLPKPAQFLIEVEQEMARVTWPSRADLIRSTILIALLSVILAVVIAVVDLFNYWLVYTNIIGGN